MQNKLICLFCLVFLFINFSLSSKAVETTSEILNLHAEYNFILIDVAKKYPKIEFVQTENPNKILIKLLNAKYHETFNYSPGIKEVLLNELNFLNDVSVELIEDSSGIENIVIDLDIKNNISLKPQIKSTINNVVKISFDTVKVKEVDSSLSEEADIPKEEQVIRLYNQAVEEQTKGNLDQAEKFYLRVIVLDNSFYLARYNLAKIYLDKRILDKAVSTLESLLKDSESNKKPMDNWLLYSVQNMLASIYYLGGDFNSALRMFKSLIKEKPDYALYYNIALVYEKVGSIDDAKKNFKKAISLNPDFPDAYFHAGFLDLITKKKKNAIDGFKKVIELAPDTKIAKLSQEELEKLEK